MSLRDMRSGLSGYRALLALGARILAFATFGNSAREIVASSLSDEQRTQNSKPGLTSNEAARRRAADGPNELPGHSQRGLLKIAREVLAEPMFLLLVAAASIYMLLGDLREALVLLASILVVLAITIFQERRTENALGKLRDLSSPRALVIRDGIEQRIAGRDVVVGDWVILREGDRVPADGIVCSATALSVDEAILTGESLSADKVACSSETEPENIGDVNRVYSGSLVVRGFGAVKITAIGARSEIGKIGGALNLLSTEATPLYREVRRLVRWVAIASIALCVLIAIVYGLRSGDGLAGVLAGITVAMGILPEEFPVVLAVFLAMGAWRISRAGVLTRRMPAIESIGAATVLAVDKTGTLTENKMQVAILESLSCCVDLREKDGPTDDRLDDSITAILGVALAASERDAFDPMERAIQEAADRWTPSEKPRLANMSLIREFDLTPELLAVTHVWRSPENSLAEIAVKGAPETVFDLCRIDATQRAALLEKIAIHARTGLRVLAVARGVHKAEALPDSPRDFKLELLGLICFVDPLRASVPAALAQCHAAGIRVIMITGDHPGTALAIAAAAGFDTTGGCLTGRDIELFNDEELRTHVRRVNIFARTKPEHKLRLVQALKAEGEVVAMTGDGVNDAPALKAAHVGVAMGIRGTDVAREAAALVLVNDDFASLVAAVRLGRRIYANIRHAMSFIVAVHVPIAGLGLIAPLLGWPLVFFPLHILFLEFVIDPACAFVFEADAESPDIMRRKPRHTKEKLFSKTLLRRALILGFTILAIELILLGVAQAVTDERSARTIVFTGLVIANLTLIFVSRSQSASLVTLYVRTNKIYWWIVGITVLTLGLAVYVPMVAEVFAFAPPNPFHVVAAALAVSISVLICGHLLRESNAHST